MEKGGRKISEPSSYHSKIKDWLPGERPREKLLKHGVNKLSDAELLAILIRSGTGNITALDIANTILKNYRSMYHLCSRGVQELRQYKGLGDTKAITIVAAFEIGRRASNCVLEEFRIKSPEDVFRRFHPEFRDLKQEIFKVVLLDSANHYLRDVKISEGILNSSLVHPREVYRPAIVEPAASIILMHNHPSGNPEPSTDDIQITRQIAEAGKIIGIPVHDHIIFAIDKFTSFAEKGLL